MVSSNVTTDEKHTEAMDEYVELQLESMGTLGDTIARLDGQEVNVFGGIPVDHWKSKLPL